MLWSDFGDLLEKVAPGGVARLTEAWGVDVETALARVVWLAFRGDVRPRATAELEFPEYEGDWERWRRTDPLPLIERVHPDEPKVPTWMVYPPELDEARLEELAAAWQVDQEEALARVVHVGLGALA